MKLIFLIAIAIIGGGSAILYSNNTATPSEISDAGSAETEVEEYEIDPADFLDDLTVAGTGSEALSESEIAGLLLMREEEKLARDVYTALADIWGLPIFSNIASSERTHAEAVYTVLELYNLQDPMATDTVGVFQNETLQQQYDDLVANGSQSIEAALTSGIIVEELDIYDLERLMSQTENADILTVYLNLQKGSRNHLRAFNRMLERYGATYEPQYLSESEFNDIINSSQERGRI